MQINCYKKEYLKVYDLENYLYLIIILETT